jgi:hypothetical protein
MPSQEKTMIRALTSAAVILLFCAAAAPVQAKGDGSTSRRSGAHIADVREAQVVSVNAANSQIVLLMEAATGAKTADGLRPVPIDAAGARPDIAMLKPGDQIRVTMSPGSDKKIDRFVQESRYADWPARWIALAGALILLTGFAGIATGGKLRSLVIGADNRYSKSQVQIVLWALLVGCAYLATVFLRVWAGGLDLLGGIDIPQNLLILSGLSVLSFGAAKAITVTKNDTPGTPRKTIGAPDLRDLVRDDQAKPDFGDLQMIVVTLIVVIVYFWTVFHTLGVVPAGKSSLPDVDLALLSAFGLGQGAYLAKKMALPIGQG